MRYVRETFPLIEEAYIKTGQVRYIFRPQVWNLENPAERVPAEALYCAGESEKFWEMHDWLHENMERWEDAADIVTVLSQVAAPEIGVDGAGLAACLRQGRYRTLLEAFQQDARQRGIQGTPTFLVNGQVIYGAHPYETFRQAIEEALQK